MRGAIYPNRRPARRPVHADGGGGSEPDQGLVGALADQLTLP